MKIDDCAPVLFARTRGTPSHFVNIYPAKHTQDGKKMPASIAVEQIAKSYGNVLALNGINTTIERGEVRGLLGANGSGKSTLMKILLGLVKPDNGLVTVEGINPEDDAVAVRQIVGYVPEAPRL